MDERERPQTAMVTGSRIGRLRTLRDRIVDLRNAHPIRSDKLHVVERLLERGIVLLGA